MMAKERATTRSRSRKTWREKLLDAKGLPRTQKVAGRMSRRWGEGTLVIPAPVEVDALMRSVRKGRLTTIDQIREALARRHGVTFACPITTGIFAWIAAHAANEAEAAGRRRITPYWRTLKAGGELNPKYPGGIEGQRRRLRSEGHEVVVRGKRSFVSGYQDALAKLPQGAASRE